MRQERGIAMAGPMVLKTLEGIKTETRRVAGDKQINRYGKVGDWLYVREKTRIVDRRSDIHILYDKVRLRYLADEMLSAWIDYPTRLATPMVCKCIANGCYKEAARIWLEIVDIGVEFLWCINKKDAIAEGCESRVRFAELWNKLNEKRGYYWESNPLVWVIKYKILSTTGRPQG